VLRTLGDGPTTISRMAERLEITEQGASQLADDMERRYVERRPDPSDARVRLLHLTDRGRAALKTARAYHRPYERRLRAQFGDAAIDGMRGADRHGRPGRAQFM
jgi:DNA-binding MarR family transcriptional regulator